MGCHEGLKGRGFSLSHVFIKLLKGHWEGVLGVSSVLSWYIGLCCAYNITKEMAKG